jgi:hypothetical protein
MNGGLWRAMRLEKTMNTKQVVISCLLWSLVGLAIWFVVRRYKAYQRRSLEKDLRTHWECPRCDSSAVERLPADSYSRRPGFVCMNCGIRLRPHGSTFTYSFLLLLSFGIMAMFMAPVFLGIDFQWASAIKFIVIASLVVAYCVRQLRRPVPRRVDDGLQ